jgi:anti-sigma factor RsiW
LTCREFVDFLMAYLDGELASEVRSTFEQHLSLCPPCKDYLTSYKDAVQLGQACESDEIPADVPERLVQAILAARKKGL